MVAAPKLIHTRSVWLIIPIHSSLHPQTRH
jgi:hypothetical protein